MIKICVSVYPPWDFSKAEGMSSPSLDPMAPATWWTLCKSQRGNGNVWARQSWVAILVPSTEARSPGLCVTVREFVPWPSDSPWAHPGLWLPQPVGQSHRSLCSSHTQCPGFYLLRIRVGTGSTSPALWALENDFFAWASVPSYVKWA